MRLGIRLACQYIYCSVWDTHMPYSYIVNILYPESLGFLFAFRHIGAIAAVGNATIKLWVRESDGTQLDGEIEKKIPYVSIHRIP